MLFSFQLPGYVDVNIPMICAPMTENLYYCTRKNNAPFPGKLIVLNKQAILWVTLIVCVS